MPNNIIWEKWTDPFGQNPDSSEWLNYDSTAESEDESFEDTENDESQTPPPMHIPTYNKRQAIATTMGIIPYNEYTDCSKIFNFWIGHTNFNITQHTSEVIQKVAGVEALDIFTRYRFRVAFGKAFNDNAVMINIQEELCNI